MRRILTLLRLSGTQAYAAYSPWIAMLAIALFVVAPADAQSPTASQAAMPGLLELGVTINKPNAYPGDTLIFPFASTDTYLIDMQGRIVNKWESKYTPGEVAFLEENGHLLRAAKLRDNEAIFAGMGPGGRIQEFTWDGRVVWDYKFHNEKCHRAVQMPPLVGGLGQPGLMIVGISTIGKR